MAEFKTTGQIEIQTILSKFGPLKKKQLHMYLDKAFHFSDPEKVERVLYRLAKLKHIYITEDGFVSVDNTFPTSYDGIFTFWVILKMMDKDLPHIDLARYPNDYIFIHENELYEVMIYGNNGNFKINYMNHMLKDELDGSIPLIIFVNQTAADIPENFKPTFPHKVVELRVDIDTDVEPEIIIKEGEIHEQ